MLPRLRLLILVSILVVATSVRAQVPLTISYQGVAMQSGVPVEGAKQIKLSLYPDSLAATPIYTNTITATFTKGLFNTQIGPFPAGFDFSKTLWLGVAIDGATEMSPRTLMTASAFAFYARSSDSTIPSTGMASGTVVTFPDNGQHPGFTYTGMKSYPNGGDTWTMGSSVPVAQRYGMCAAVNGKIYVLGGQAGTSDDNQIFDPLTDTWSSGKRIPTPQSQGACGVVNGKIYVLGGEDGNHTENQIYDPVADQWSQGSPLPVPVWRAAYQTLNNKIYLCGGFEQLNQEHKAVQIFDASSNKWTIGAPMLDTIVDAASCIVNGEIYLFGGLHFGAAITTCQIYDPAADAWRWGPSLPYPVSGAACTYLDGKIYLIGGQAVSTVGSNQVFDIATKSWSILSPLPVGVSYAESALLNGKFYIIGGITAVRAANQIYTPPPKTLYFYTKN